MAETLADKLKKQRLASNTPSQGFGDMRVAEQQGLNPPVVEPVAPEESPEAPEAPEVLKGTELEAPKLANRLRKSDSALRDLQSLADKYEQEKLVPKDRTDELKQKIADARQLYNTQSNRNDWLEVAQTLGQAVAQLGAGMQGQRSHRDMSNIQMGKGIDYGARSDRAAKEYQTESELLRNTNQDQRKSELDAADAQKDVFAGKRKSLEDALSTYREREKDEDIYDRAKEVEGIRAGRDDKRLQVRDRADQDREEQKSRQMQAQTLREQLKGAQVELQASRELANNAAADSDLKSKSRDQLAQRYGALAAKAGVDPSALADITAQSQDSGVLGTGILKSEDKAKKAKLIQEQLVQPKQDKINSLMAAIEKLSSGRPKSSPVQSQKVESSAGAPDTQNAKTAPSPSQEPTPDMIQKYVKMYPQVSAEQARDILKKRLGG